MGRTEGPDRARPFAILADGRPEGAPSPDGRVQGTYVHGLFADDAQRAAWLARLGGAASGASYEAGVEAALDALARHLEAHLDLDAPAQPGQVTSASAASSATSSPSAIQ